jgi:hypothetical protein
MVYYYGPSNSFAYTTPYALPSTLTACETQVTPVTHTVVNNVVEPVVRQVVTNYVDHVVRPVVSNYVEPVVSRSCATTTTVPAYGYYF